MVENIGKSVSTYRYFQSKKNSGDARQKNPLKAFVIVPSMATTPYPNDLLTGSHQIINSKHLELLLLASRSLSHRYL